MTGSPFEFSTEISVDEIERFLRSPGDTPIVAWSMQNTGAIELLKKNGHLTGDPKYMFVSARPGKRAAYEWMRQMMANRIDNYQQEWPVWCLPSRPQSTRNIDDKLMRLEIPKSKMLISFYQPWESLLGVMAFLETRNMQWPSQWLHFECDSPLFNPIVDDSWDDNWPNVIPVTFDEKECRASWEQIFDLTLAGRKGFGWWGIPRLQAMVSEVTMPELMEILPIPIAQY